MLTSGAVFEFNKALSAFTFQRAGSYRLLAVRLHHLMGNAAHMPQLQRNTATLGVNRIHDAFPACFLLVGPNAGRVHITTGSGRNVGGFANDQARTGALAVISFLHLARHAIRRTRTGQRRMMTRLGMDRLPSVVGVNSVSYAIEQNSFAAVGIIVASRIDQFTSKRQQRCYA